MRRKKYYYYKLKPFSRAESLKLYSLKNNNDKLKFLDQWFEKHKLLATLDIA